MQTRPIIIALFLAFAFTLFFRSELLAQSNFDVNVNNELQNIKAIPSSTHPSISGEVSSLTVFDSSFTRIVRYGTKVIPSLIKRLGDTTSLKIENPCYAEEKMKMHDLVWFLIQEIEPFPRYDALHLVFCTEGDCEHFPQGFFNFIHSDPKLYASRYKKYFYSKRRVQYLNKKVT